MSSQIIQTVAVSPATAWAISHRGHDFEDPNEDYWYAIFVGRAPGAHPKDHDVAANLLDIPGASVMKCHTEEEANTEFAKAVQSGIAARVELTQTSRYLDMTALDSLPLATVSDDVTASRRWYSVTVGRFPGVYNGPSGLTANIAGISGAAAMKFKTRSDAVQHFTKALNAGLVVECAYTVKRFPL